MLLILLCRVLLPFTDIYNIASADIFHNKYRVKTLRTFLLFLPISLRFLTSITTGTSGTISATRLLSTVVYSTSTSFSLLYCIYPVSSSTPILRSLRYLLFFSASTFHLVRRTQVHLPLLLLPVHLVVWYCVLTPLPVVLCKYCSPVLLLLHTYCHSRVGVLCFSLTFYFLVYPCYLGHFLSVFYVQILLSCSLLSLFVWYKTM
jgi:hypothetical protein